MVGFALSANLLEKGIAYYLKGDLQTAGELWNKYFSSRRDPIARGFRKLAQGQFMEASLAFNSYRKESRTSYYGKYEWLKYLGLSLAASELGYFQREWFAAKAREFAPNSPIVIFVQGVYDLQMGNLKRAEKRLSLAVKKLKDGIFALFLSRVYIQKGDLEKAREIFEEYRFPELGVELARAYKERGDLIQGWELLKTLPKTPQVVSLMMDFAFTLERDYMVKEVQPLVSDPLLSSEIEAYFLVRNGKCRRAKKILTKLSLYRPEDHFVWDWLARCEKKRERKLKYLYLSFFNGGDVPNLFGVKRLRVIKIDMAKWLGDENLVVLGRVKGTDTYGLYLWNPETGLQVPIPLRGEVEDFYPQKDGKTLVISVVNRIRGRRSFYIWNEMKKPRRAVVMRLTEEKFVGEIRGDHLLVYSEDFLTLPFQSPFKKIVNLRNYYPLYSPKFPFLFIDYNLKTRRSRKIRSLKALPFMPLPLSRYALLKSLYRENPDFRSIIDTHSSVASETVKIDFLGDSQDAVVYRVSGEKKFLLGYIKEGVWKPLRIKEGKEEYEFLAWMKDRAGFVCRNDGGRGYIFWERQRKFRKLEKKMGDAVYLNEKLYFLAGDDEGKKRLYLYDPKRDDTERLTDYLWSSLGNLNSFLLLKDPTTTAYILKGDSILPVYVEDNKIILRNPSVSRIFLYLPSRKDVYLVNLK